jgi:TolA-binding protein
VLATHDFQIARFYQRTGKKGACVDRLKGLLKSYPESTYQPDHFFMLGCCLEDLEQNAEACTYFTQTIERWPDSEFASKSRQHQVRVCK